MPKGRPLDTDLFVEAVMAGRSQSEAALMAGSDSIQPADTASRFAATPAVQEALERARAVRRGKLEAIWDAGIEWVGKIISAPMPDAPPTNIDRSNGMALVGRAIGAFQPTVVEHRHFKVPMRSLLDNAKVVDANLSAPTAPSLPPAWDDIPCDP